MRKRTPHWITGLGALSAAGVGTKATGQTLFTSSPLPPDILDVDHSHFFKLKIQDDWWQRFDLPQAFTPNLFALMAASEAFASAGLRPEDLRSLRVGVCIGSTVGGTNYDDDFNSKYFRGELPDSRGLFNYFKNNSAQFLSRYYGCRGPVLMVSNACTSGADAIGIGASWLRADLCDLVLCGGTEVILEKIYQGFRALMLCSPRPCTPFDRDRSGLTLGEGAGMVILEKVGSPREPLAVLHGYGVASDAYHPTAPHPEARGLVRATQFAMAEADLNLNQIDFVNAHGTATLHNDLAEGRWLKKNVPGARAVATKGYTGHTLGAAGAIEAVFTALSLQRQKLPSSRGFSTVDPEIALTPSTKIESIDAHYALSLSLGFGGTNTVLCLGRAP